MIQILQNGLEIFAVSDAKDLFALAATFMTSHITLLYVEGSPVLPVPLCRPKLAWP